MASMNSGILASQVKDFEVYDFPFMFANAARKPTRWSTAPSARRCTPSWSPRASSA
jgi:TRAP-type C4-dicarboxylate transport system substrate-binding protein